jgi:hypothetical protein
MDVICKGAFAIYSAEKNAPLTTAWAERLSELVG